MKDNKLLNNNTKPIILFLTGCFLGFVIFGIIYGYEIVNPKYDQWIYTLGGDRVQHYLGWEFYRNSKWDFPIGLIENLTSEGSVSVIYTDSIPILAIFFKIFSGLLPETFQYIGIWELLSFMLMGGFSAILLRKYSKNPLFCIIGSIPYIIAPSIIQRAFKHEALSGQWIIIIALILFVNSNRKWKRKSSLVLLWSALGITAAMTHIYFIPMIYMIMAGYIFKDIFREKKIIRPLTVFVSTTVSSLTAMYITGAFYGDGEYQDKGLGVFSANFNALFNSYGYSKFLKPMNIVNKNSEGFGYLGLGMIMLSFIAVILLFNIIAERNNNVLKSVKDIAAEKWVEIISVVIVVSISIFLSVSPTATLNGRIIYIIDYPEKITRILSIFRASGRFIWVTVFLVYTFSLKLISKVPNKKTMIFTLIMCLSVQCLDLRDYILENHDLYSSVSYNYNTALRDKRWGEIVKDKKEIVFLPLKKDYLTYKDTYFLFAELALKNNIKLSSFYLARANVDNLIKYSEEQYDELLKSNVREDALYVFFKADLIPENVQNLKVMNIDGYYIGIHE